MLKDLVHRAFGEEYGSIFALVKGGHHLADGIKGQFVFAGKLVF